MRTLLSRVLCAVQLLVLVIAEPVPTRTIVDVLSSRPEFSELVELLQHRGLIPTINQSWNSTFLAPVNSAFIGVDKSEITSDQLLYHFVDSLVLSEDFVAHTKVVNTYLDANPEDGLDGAPITLSAELGINNGKADIIDSDLLASPRRGVVHAISDVIPIPEPLAAHMYIHKTLSAFSGLVGEMDLRGCTLFAPSSNAFSDWISIATSTNSTAAVLKYLLSPFGEDDRHHIIHRHVARHLIDQSRLPATVELADGTMANIYENWTIHGPGFEAHALDTRLHVARDGLIVVLSEVAAPAADSFINLTPEKMILGLGGYNFVRALELYGHRDLIDGSITSDEPEMIIVPTGAALPPVDEKPDSRAIALANPSDLTVYQFLKGHLPQKASSKLLDSHMRLRSGKLPQRVHFERRNAGSLTLNWETLGESFCELGNSRFYTTEEMLAAPPSLVMSLGPLLVSSYSLSFLENLGRLRLPTDRSWTLFVPTRDAWEQQILLMKYLQTNTDALIRVFDNLILQEAVYSDSEPSQVHQYSGVDTEVSWDENNRLFTLRNDLFRDSVATLEAEVTDVLFDNGVAHIVTSFQIPSNLEITAQDLIKAGERSLFLDLLEAAGLGDVLDPHANFTILVPPENDLRKHNYNTSSDRKQLQDLLMLHLLPGNPIDDLFKADGVGTTMADEDLELHEILPSGVPHLWAISPKSAAEGQRVLITGSTNTNGIQAGGSTVVLIDRHISPEWVTPIKFGLRKGTYAILGLLFGVVLASVLIFGLVYAVSKPKDPHILSDEDILDPDYRDEEEATDGNSIEGQTGPMETPRVSENRTFGRHLQLPN